MNSLKYYNPQRHFSIYTRECCFCGVTVTDEHIDQHIDNITHKFPMPGYHPVCASPECQFRRQINERAPIKTRFKRL